MTHLPDVERSVGNNRLFALEGSSMKQQNPGVNYSELAGQISQSIYMTQMFCYIG